MLSLLALAVLTLTAMDHWTTYLCLQQQVPGFTVSEANPLSAWLFLRLGLIPGLLLDSLITAFAVLFLLVTPRIPSRAKAFFFLMLGASTTGAVANNVRAIEALRIASHGLS